MTPKSSCERRVAWPPVLQLMENKKTKIKHLITIIIIIITIHHAVYLCMLKCTESNVCIFGRVKIQKWYNYYFITDRVPTRVMYLLQYTRVRRHTRCSTPLLIHSDLTSVRHAIRSRLIAPLYDGEYILGFSRTVY